MIKMKSMKDIIMLINFNISIEKYILVKEIQLDRQFILINYKLKNSLPFNCFIKRKVKNLYLKKLIKNKLKKHLKI